VSTAFDTVTVIVDEVVLFPAASRATALSVCDPFATPKVFQLIEYGLDVTSDCKLAPSSLNCTPATATSSVALAEIVVVPEIVTPVAGAVIETAGEVVSGTDGVVRVNTLLAGALNVKAPPLTATLESCCILAEPLSV
jgi:hypothetical protein